MIKLIPLDNVFNYLPKTLRRELSDDDQIRSWALQALRTVNHGQRYIKDISFHDIENHRANLPDDEDGFYNKNYSTADSNTKFWWAGADGKGPETLEDYLRLFFPNNGIAGWSQSGGAGAGDVGSQRIKTLVNGQTRSGYAGNEFVGPEYGIARSLYDKGRRKVIILKVSYGFQSLEQSNSPAIPWDWNIHSTGKSYDKLKSEFSKLTSYIRDDLDAKYTVDGFFWTQGGTDTIQPSYADNYKENLRELLLAARNDFQLHPNAHIVTAKIAYQQCVDHSFPLIGIYCGIPWGKNLEPLEFAFEEILNGRGATVQPAYVSRLNQVRDSIQEVADDYSWVDTMDVGDQPRAWDFVHLNEVGQLTVGKRFTNMYKFPYRVDEANVVVGSQVRTPTDFDGDGIANNDEDNGNSCSSGIINNQNGSTDNNGNLGDDDADCDGFPDYLDRVNGVGSGL